MQKVLVLCTGNSCRSQIAHGYLKHFAGNKALIYSAGVETHGLNPRAVAVMQEDHIDISNHTSNHVEEYADILFDYVITVCDHANEVCPVFPGTSTKIHQNFPDPAKAAGSEEEVLNSFRSVRDQIKSYCRDFVSDSL